MASLKATNMRKPYLDAMFETVELYLTLAQTPYPFPQITSRGSESTNLCNAYLPAGIGDLATCLADYTRR